jgi:hypothetical protein
LADNLLVFLEAAVQSVHCIKKVIKEFVDLSGLQANQAKSSFYCASVSPRMQELLIEFSEYERTVIY